MLKILKPDLAPAVALLLTASAARADISLASLLEEMTNYESVARWPEPEYRTLQASSYDRGTKSPDEPGWFANTDQNQFIRTETIQGRTEKVMMDADGPGCVVRFWLTTDQKKEGTLRFYLDGGEEPALVFPAYDLLSGDPRIGAPLAQPHPGYRPDANGGNSFYLPVPYARHCKITWEEAGNSSRYYQINYRTYAPGTKVESFTRAALDAARPLVETVNKTLLSPPDAPSEQKTGWEAELPPRGTKPLDLPPGPAAVRRLELRVPKMTEQELRSLIVRMECDGERTIWCPAGDFFGSGVGVNEVRNWYRTVEKDGTMVCRWVMPYRKNARITLENLGKEAVKVSLSAVTSPWRWDARSMHFHTTWHFENGLATPPARDWNFVKIAGGGVYVGDTLTVFNPVATWYGEGDEKIWVDGEKISITRRDRDGGLLWLFLRAEAGTPDAVLRRAAHRPSDDARPQHLHAHAQPGCHSFPAVAAIRHRADFVETHHTHLRGDDALVWAAGGEDERYGASARGDAARSDAGGGDRGSGNRVTQAGGDRVRDGEGAEEVREFLRGAAGYGPFGGERWSSGTQLLGKAGAVGDSFEIEIPCPDKEPRKLVLHATHAPDFATLRFRVNGKDVKERFDGYAAGVEPAPAFELGIFKPDNGVFKLGVEVAGANEKSAGARFYLGLDCVLFGEGVRREAKRRDAEVAERGAEEDGVKKTHGVRSVDLWSDTG